LRKPVPLRSQRHGDGDDSEPLADTAHGLEVVPIVVATDAFEEFPRLGGGSLVVVWIGGGTEQRTRRPM
jgi:hypothetical protein